MWKNIENILFVIYEAPDACYQCKIEVLSIIMSSAYFSLER